MTIFIGGGVMIGRKYSMG